MTLGGWPVGLDIKGPSLFRATRFSDGTSRVRVTVWQGGKGVTASVDLGRDSTTRLGEVFGHPESEATGEGHATERIGGPL